MEEDCDGLCWQYIVNEDKIRPDVVVVTDSTDCKILRGQRGRMEIGVTCLGKSCHGSMPEKGDNAVYKIAKVVREIEELNTRLKGDEFLGKGTIRSVTSIARRPACVRCRAKRTSISIADSRSATRKNRPSPK